MALKKSQLYSSLWQSCDELRGGMDASQYKDYVLTLLFMKYVSDRHAGRPDALIDIPAGGDFADIAALKGRKDIGEQINVIVRRFAEANDLHDVNGLDPAHDEFRRFEYGVPPARNGDYAFLLHLVASLTSRGKGAIILPHGVLFRGNREADIRRNLVRRGLVKGIIGLPPNLFYGTGIPACIVVIDKENAGARRGIFMVDASRGFRKDGAKNRLRAQDIHRIVDVFNNQTETPRYARMAPVSEIADPANDYNLNIPRYVAASEPEDLHDLDAHLNGGIPDRDLDALGAWWDVFPSLRATLFEDAGRPGYSRLRVDPSQIDAAIRDHPEFDEYRQQVGEVFDLWRDVHRPILHDLTPGDAPGDVIDALSENLLTAFAGLPLISPYDVYQRLLDYWDDVMQDDVHLVVSDGWVDAAKPRATIEDKHRKIKETPDLTIQRRRYKMDLVPPPLIAARWFADEQAEVDALRATHDEVVRALEALIEDHSSTADGDDGPLAATVNDRGRITKAAVTARVREVEADPESHDEMEPLLRCLALMDAEAAASRAVKAAEVALDAQVLARYDTLTEAEIKILVVDDKWFATIHNAVKTQVNRATRRLAVRTKELERRYARPLPRLEREVDAFSAKVRCHLDHMGCSSESDVDSRSRLPTQSNPAHLNAQDDAATPT